MNRRYSELTATIGQIEDKIDLTELANHILDLQEANDDLEAEVGRLKDRIAEMEAA